MCSKYKTSHDENSKAKEKEFLHYFLKMTNVIESFQTKTIFWKQKMNFSFGIRIEMRFKHEVLFSYEIECWTCGISRAFMSRK